MSAQKVAVVKYNAGNVQSVLFALERLGIAGVYTDDAAELRKADKVIFPGQGHAKATMEYLREKKLDAVICSLRQPVLGICIGMQLLCSYSEEGDTTCLGIFPQKVRQFAAAGSLKVPHMGWNSLQHRKGTLFSSTVNEDAVYFVHSYYVENGPGITAEAEYIVPFAAALQRDNFFAVQFHPEKSGVVGQKILQTFLNL